MNILFLVPLICAIVIYTISFKEGKQICDNYILVSYLYALFYLSLVSCGIKFFIDNKTANKMSVLSVLGVGVVSIIVQLVLLSTSKTWVIWKHVLSVIFSLILSLLLSVIFVWYAPSSIVMAVFSTLALFVSLTLIAWKYQESLPSHIGVGMLLLFLAVILAEFFIGMFYPNSLLEKGIILVVMMILGYLVLVKTKRMIENKKNCESEGGPDYVNEGTGLMLTFENLLIRVLSLFGKKKLK
jgi:FtsH-binding integral membrane protein